MAVFCFLHNFNTALAQSIADPNSSLQQGVQVIEQPLGLPATDIRLIIARIIRIALGLLGTVLVVLIMYAGFLWMTAGGNEEQIAKAKAMLKNAIIGLAIILSAVAIVTFVINSLISATTSGGGDGGPDLGGPEAQNFQGSGALGKVVKDHYPARNQVNVPRNTKIVVTFSKPILPSSFIEDTTSDGIFGNCKLNMTSWVTECDRVKTENNKLSNKYINIKRADNGEQIPAAAILVNTDTVNNVKGVYTISLKPLIDFNIPNGGYLGSTSENLSYQVRLGDGILSDDTVNNNPSIFNGKSIGNNYYEWQFTCNNTLDLEPPFVQSIYPLLNSNATRNTVIQVDFSEPMDPVGIQGEFAIANDNSYFYITGSNVFLTSKKSSKPLGSFTLVNNYRTLEFTPSMVCGVNACGGKIYCLPVCDLPSANCKQDTYKLLVKAAQTFAANSFEAKPFTGAMDLSGNALDGNNDKKVDTAPTDPPVFDNWGKPDNYFWQFNIKDEIDNTPPYLIQIQPGVDAENVEANTPWTLLFSKRMRIASLYNIGVEEKPTPAERKDNIPLCKWPTVNLGDKTLVTMGHCAFLQTIQQYYFPIVPSTVEDVNFNCFYPGMGPGGDAEKQAQNPISSECAPGSADNKCCPVDKITGKSLCCDGEVSDLNDTPEKCINNLKAGSLLGGTKL